MQLPNRIIAIAHTLIQIHTHTNTHTHAHSIQSRSLKPWPISQSADSYFTSAMASKMSLGAQLNCQMAPQRLTHHHNHDEPVQRQELSFGFLYVGTQAGSQPLHWDTAQVISALAGRALT